MPPVNVRSASHATVVAARTGFHWVEVNRDHDPANDEYFNVSVCPSLIAVNLRREGIYHLVRSPWR